MRVLDAAPEWIRREVNRAIADKVLRGNKEETRRVREALDWADRELQSDAKCGCDA